MRNLNRKQKIKRIRDLSAGNDPDSKEHRVHMLLNKMSCEQLNNLLKLRKLPKQEIETILKELGIYTTEEVLAFLASEEFNSIMSSKAGDHFVIFKDFSGNEPLHEPNEVSRAIESIKAPLREPQPEKNEEPQHEAIDKPKAPEQEPASIKLIKDNREQELKIFNLLGEVMEQDKERAEKMDRFRKQYNQLN